MTAADQACATVKAGDSRRQALRAMMDALRSAGSSTPDIDARFLLQGILGIDSTELAFAAQAPVGAASAALNGALARRLRHEPVSRILGRRDFYGRTFLITPDVLDPRPETETVVDLALDLVRAAGLDRRPIRVADIGTGSGILIATLLAELPLAQGVASDISPSALAVASANADRLGVGNRASFCIGSGLENCGGRFELIVSNPPYIESGAIAALDADVRDYDPRVALDGGPDGLAIYRKIAIDINSLKGFSIVVLEIGAGQGRAVAGIFESAGATWLGSRCDLGGHERAVAFQIHS